MAFIALLASFPCQIPNEFAKDVFSTAISVLSIVFSIYFAALATIASASDDDFIRFLEEDQTYSDVISAFKFTLGLLFVALLMSLAAYVATSYWAQSSGSTQSLWWLAVVCFVAVWSLLATYFSAGDSIQYATARMRFLKYKSTSADRQDSASDALAS